jgi:hypothetical protein
MKKAKIVIVIALAAWVLVHDNHNVNAFYNAQEVINAQASYPLPEIKPVSTCQKDQKNDNLDKKQAAAAALGLYLGLKIATVPQGFKKINAKALNCAG